MSIVPLWESSGLLLATSSTMLYTWVSIVRELTLFYSVVASGNGLLVPGSICSLKRAHLLGEGTVSLSPVPVMRRNK